MLLVMSLLILFNHCSSSMERLKETFLRELESSKNQIARLETEKEKLDQSTSKNDRLNEEKIRYITSKIDTLKQNIRKTQTEIGIVEDRIKDEIEAKNKKK